MIIDVHTHATPHDGSLAVVNLALQSGQPLPSPLPRWFSAGIHPWQAHRNSVDELAWLVAQPGCLAVGEAGLDRLKGAPPEVQTAVFARQVRLARDIGKPLIVHAVRTQSEVLGILHREAPGHGVMIHGFNGKPSTAARWLENGCYLSFGAVLLHRQSPVHEALRLVPLHQLFLETDSSGCTIGDIYARAAGLLGIETEVLAHRIWQNFQTLFSSYE